MITVEQELHILDSTSLGRDTLQGETIIVTGSGRGIGFETARASCWLGGTVVIAEIDENLGSKALQSLEGEFEKEQVMFVKTDVGSEESIQHLKEIVEGKMGKVDGIINNATVTPMGSIETVTIDQWDRSYRVNLRGPVLLARAFLPGMKKRQHGAFACVSSSGAAPYMGAYEVFKTAQVELASTISAELEDSGVFAFTIGPGIVKTPGFLKGGGEVAKLMGITIEELIDMNRNAFLTAEEAGTGFAAAIALASKYSGTEIGSIQVLRDIGYEKTFTKSLTDNARTVGTVEEFNAIKETFRQQARGWQERNLFQRQWIRRDFKKHVGMPIDEMMAVIEAYHGTKDEKSRIITILEKLREYYAHQKELLKGWEKDPAKMVIQMKEIESWIAAIDSFLNA